MRYFLIGFIVLMFTSVTVMAQDGCEIELEDTILNMIQAQRAADSGDTLTAVALLQGVQSSIDSVTTGCDGVRFANTYTSPDDDLSFRYPDDWQVQTPSQGLYVVTSSSAVLEAIEEDLPEDLAIGEGGIVLQVQPTDAGDFEETIDDIIDDIRRDVTIISPQEESTIRGRQVVSFDVSLSDTVSGHISFVDYTSDEEDAPSAVMLILGVANSQSLPIIKVYTQTLRESIQFPPGQALREIGVDVADVSYESFLDIEDELDLDVGRFAKLSPDGTQLAYIAEDALCTASVDTGEDSCVDIPPSFDSRPTTLYWSPDSRFIAFHQDAFRLFIEADIWVYEVAESNFVNLTDDGTDEFGLEDINVETWIDGVMTWGPDNMIYAVRNVLTPADDNIRDAPQFIIQVNPESGETTTLVDITDTIPWGSIFEFPEPFLDGSMSVSPDATQLAVTVNPVDLEDPNTGIWLMDLTGSEAPTQIATRDDFTGGLPPEFFEDGNRVYAGGVAWDAEGTGLYFYTLDPTRGGSRAMVHHFDLVSGEVIPMFDLSDLSEDDMEEQLDDTTFPSPFYVPYTATLASDYSGVVIAHGTFDDIAISLFPFDGTFDDPITLFTDEDLYRSPGGIVMALNGNMQQGYVLILNEGE